VDLIISTLGKSIDLKTVVEARVELAEKYLASKEYIGKGDAAQASEKMYKVVEECIKALAQHYNMPEHEVAVKEGMWWTQLLGKAARGLSRTLNEPRITDVWARAYDIHVWGFHESKYTIEDINEDTKHIDWLLNYVKQKAASNQQ
jgi:predicted choloylglycine hydrolase